MFVGRNTLVAEMLDRTAQHGGLDLRGDLGSGKTSLLSHLDSDIQVFQRFLVNLETYNPGHDGEIGDSASVGAVQGSFQKFTELLAYLIEQACPDELDAFKSDIVAAYNSEVVGRRVYSLEEATEVLDRRLEPKDLADLWRAAASAVGDSFVPRWNAGHDDRLLLLDNVDEVADQEIGAWLGPLLARLERTAVVFTSQAESLDTPGPLTLGDVPVDKQVLLPFDQREVDEYLDEVEPAGVPDADRQTVYDISGGHPGTVTIVHDLLWRRGVGANEHREEALRDLPEPQREKVAALVERLVEQVDDQRREKGSDKPVMLDALWASVVPRRFNAKLLKTLLGDLSLSDDDHRRVFDEVRRFPFVESLTPDGASLRLQSYVRQGLLDDLSRSEGDRYDRLHERAAEYYNAVVFQEQEDAEGGGYGDAYIYEDPRWQRNKREWLYHRGHAAQEGAKRQALVEFARIFLEAFWWWGNYIRFDFCDQLVADLAQLVRQRDPNRHDRTKDALPPEAQDRSWSDLDQLYRSLKCILQLYPPRSGKTKDAQWDEIRDTLLTVKEKCGLLERRQPPTLEDELVVAALLEVFSAHTYRYQDPQHDKALEHYEKARTLFASLNKMGKHEWSTPWVDFELADLYFERRKPDQGVEHVRDPWSRAADAVQPPDSAADDEPDEELTANLHRLRGDCCWVSGDRPRAATWYGRAILHAYLFHTVGGPPDEYTLQFYVDIRAGVISRLFETWGRGDHDEALQLAEQIAGLVGTTFGESRVPAPEELRARFENGTPLPLAQELFPRGPEVTELGPDDSPFAKEVRRRKMDLDYGSIDGDLHDDHWP